MERFIFGPSVDSVTVGCQASTADHPRGDHLRTPALTSSGRVPARVMVTQGAVCLGSVNDAISPPWRRLRHARAHHRTSPGRCAPARHGLGLGPALRGGRGLGGGARAPWRDRYRPPARGPTGGGLTQLRPPDAAPPARPYACERRARRSERGGDRRGRPWARVAPAPADRSRRRVCGAARSKPRRAR